MTIGIEHIIYSNGTDEIVSPKNGYLNIFFSQNPKPAPPSGEDRLDNDILLLELKDDFIPKKFSFRRREEQDTRHREVFLRVDLDLDDKMLNAFPFKKVNLSIYQIKVGDFEITDHRNLMCILLIDELKRKTSKKQLKKLNEFITKRNS